MNAPGSPSSALQTTYLTSDCCLLANSHFSPVGKPPPPRPRSPERLIISINVRRLFVKQAIGQCKVSFTGDILFDIFGIDKTTVTQCNAELFPVEIHVLGVADGMFRFRIYI